MNASLIRRIVPERYRPIGYLTHLVRQRTDCKVRLGPFAGMRYVSNSIGGAYLPKLLGIYERELTQVMEAACARQPRLIVDIGAAEGYYAVGLALRNPQATVIAFEAEENWIARSSRSRRTSGPTCCPCWCCPSAPSLFRSKPTCLKRHSVVRTRGPVGVC